jgi:ubiquinone/menaquinone biosynthesis C-methylase UbiE
MKNFQVFKKAITLFQLIALLLLSSVEAGKFSELMEASLKKAASERDYHLYAQSMDETIRKKFELFASWLPSTSQDTPLKILDVGTGPGTLAYQMACHFPMCDVYGVDLSEIMIEKANSSFQQKNLSFLRVNAADLELRDVDAMIYSSIFHEIFSFSGDSLESVQEALKTASQSLKAGGRLIIRDFLSPKNDAKKVIFYVQKDFSSPAMSFPSFSEDFNKIHKDKIEYRVHSEDSTSIGYETSLNHALEYLYRYKDSHWVAELSEKYFFWTEEDINTMFTQAGFKIIHLAHLPNSDRVDELRAQKVVLIDATTHKEIPFPMDKVLVIAEKIQPNP